MARRRLISRGNAFAGGAADALSQTLGSLLSVRMQEKLWDKRMAAEQAADQARLTQAQQAEESRRRNAILDRVASGELTPQQAAALGVPLALAQSLFSEDRAYEQSLEPTRGAKSVLDVQTPDAVISGLRARGIQEAPGVKQVAQPSVGGTLPSLETRPSAGVYGERGLSAAKSRQEQILGEEGRVRQAGIQEAGDKAYATARGSGTAQSEIAENTLPFRTQEAQTLATATGRGKTAAEQESAEFDITKARRLSEAQALGGVSPDVTRGKAAQAGAVSGAEEAARIQTRNRLLPLMTNIEQQLAQARVTGTPAAGAEQGAIKLFSRLVELSRKVNTGETGPETRTRGFIAKMGAKLGTHPDAFELETLREGYAPIFARLLGHTGVLTQLDITSTKAILPGLGLTDVEIGRLEANFSLIAPAAAKIGATLPPIDPSLPAAQQSAEYQRRLQLVLAEIQGTQPAASSPPPAAATPDVIFDIDPRTGQLVPPRRRR